MKSIAIYVEGGGDTVEQRKELRVGIDGLLRCQKQAAQAKFLRWKTVPSGGRQQTYEAFVHEVQHADDTALCVLLVDSEDELPGESSKQKGATQEVMEQCLAADAQTRKSHLTKRDKWNLKRIPAENIHLMVRCMEAWIIADPEALIRFYGSAFNAGKLPTSPDLENEVKSRLYAKLKEARASAHSGVFRQDR